MRTIPAGSERVVLLFCTVESEARAERLASSMNLDDLADSFGRYVWPWLVEHRFLARGGIPNKYQLDLYRRFLGLTGRLSTMTPEQQRENGAEWEGIFHRFRCIVCGDRLRDEWPAADDTCSLCVRDPNWKEHTA